MSSLSARIGRVAGRQRQLGRTGRARRPAPVDTRFRGYDDAALTESFSRSLNRSANAGRAERGNRTPKGPAGPGVGPHPDPLPEGEGIDLTLLAFQPYRARSAYACRARSRARVRPDTSTSWRSAAHWLDALVPTREPWNWGMTYRASSS